MARLLMWAAPLLIVAAPAFAQDSYLSASAPAAAPPAKIGGSANAHFPGSGDCSVDTRSLFGLGNPQ